MHVLYFYIIIYCDKRTNDGMNEKRFCIVDDVVHNLKPCHSNFDPPPPSPVRYAPHPLSYRARAIP